MGERINAKMLKRTGTETARRRSVSAARPPRRGIGRGPRQKPQRGNSRGEVKHRLFVLEFSERVYVERCKGGSMAARVKGSENMGIVAAQSRRAVIHQRCLLQPTLER
ncbi:hypothetical protein EVAR_14264_1 [Eumeta japonica]|uniref:Uncharacterized protein n=1 Tax=Eumeta variegata TaxID=151549 RepID=A0A4C1WB77_EUMVA|nr:hypothetical protein EVAR_14264_1 [Eumeta japonica]